MVNQTDPIIKTLKQLKPINPLQLKQRIGDAIGIPWWVHTKHKFLKFVIDGQGRGPVVHLNNFKKFTHKNRERERELLVFSRDLFSVLSRAGGVFSSTSKWVPTGVKLARGSGGGS